MPKKEAILLYDNHGNDIASKLFKKKTYGIFYSRKESINIPILIKSFFKHFFKLNYLNYSNSYIDHVNPKILITFNDNNLGFYQINKKKRVSIAVQRGNRSYHNDILSVLKKNNLKYQLDYYFVFNTSYSNHIKKFIKANYILLGSPLSNLHKIEKKKKKGICYISTFAIQTYMDALNDKKFYKKFYASEIKFLTKLSKLAKLLKTQLFILGKRKLKTNQIIEKKFYEGIDKNIKFIENFETRNTFKKINYKLSVGISSSLNLELLGRKNKVFFFLSRLKSYPFTSKKFGYFGKLPPEGPFWSSSDNYDLIIEKIKKFYLSSDAEWQKTYVKFNNKYGCYFNYKNTNLKKIIFENI